MYSNCNINISTIDLEHCTLILWTLLVRVFATGNIGYGKTATQSGTWGGLTADRALDGRGFGAGQYKIDWCAHTEASRLSPVNTPAYWTVDLVKRHQLLNVTIYNRQGKFSLKLLF